MRRSIIFSVCFFCYAVSVAQKDSITPVTYFRTYGVKINVTDMDKAIDFYTTKLGFQVESRKDFPKAVLLNSNGSKDKLILNLVNNIVDEKETDVKANLTLQVNDYDSAYARLKSKGVDFGNNIKRKEGVGYGIYFTDPFGTRLSMMHVTVVKEERFTEPRIYNYGITINDMDTARAFFAKLGFVERSQRYLPLDMPLGHPDKSFAFMLHEREGVESIHYNTANDEHIVILFKTTDLQGDIKKLKAVGITVIQKKIQQNQLGKYISFRDSFGLVYELVEEK
jgi:predicted enzyme related to lactoylglutathione lyase